MLSHDKRAKKKDHPLLLVLVLLPMLYLLSAVRRTREDEATNRPHGATNGRLNLGQYAIG